MTSLRIKVQERISFLNALKSEKNKRNGKGGHAALARRRINAADQMGSFNERFSVY